MSEEFEWCTDCKEYDQEHHCCHRATKVIRKTVEELEAAGKGKPNKDLISRSELIEYLKAVTVTDGITFETGFKQILTDIKQMPPANKPIGRWIPVDDKFDAFDCSECGAMVSKQLNYCPECGAAMIKTMEDPEV